MCSDFQQPDRQCDYNRHWVRLIPFVEFLCFDFVRFIVLEHDLYEITVDLAIGYNLETAQNHNPAFTVRFLL